MYSLPSHPKPGDRVNIYVPAPGHESAVAQSIAPGSGIVGYQHDSGRLMLYFEGNLYDACNLRKWDERVQHAYGRLTHRYPTVAKTLADPEKFVKIGTIEGSIIHVTDHNALDRWNPATPAPRRPRP